MSKSWMPYLTFSSPSNESAMPDPTLPVSQANLTQLQPDQIAIFLDFDGTLAAIEEHPDAVSVPPATLKTLTELDQATGGAIAIITGRPIIGIDYFLKPLRLPIAGVHGLERRGADGTYSNAPINQQALDAVADSLTPFVKSQPHLWLEAKRGSIALHFRQRPDLAQECADKVAQAIAAYPSLHVLPGKMVFEIKAGTSSKADAIAAFMREAPFVGRRPLFAGDDVTDEQAFPLITRLNGISIKIGAGETRATHRSADPATFAQWLGQLAAHFRRRDV